MTIAALLTVGLGLAAAAPALWPAGPETPHRETAPAARATGRWSNATRTALRPTAVLPGRPGTPSGKDADHSDTPNGDRANDHRSNDEPTADDASAPATGAGNTSPGGGERILQFVRQKLIDYQPFRADVLETVVVGSRKFTLMGQYLQGRDLLLRLQLQLQVGNTKGWLLEVCDGQVLSTRLQIGEDVQVTRRDVRQILRAAVAEPDVPENLLIAELGLGGLSGLLASLEWSMDFGPARTETIDGRQFTVIEGWWNDTFWQKWEKQGRRTGRDLPDYVPDGVRIYLDESDFPRRFLYVKRVSGGKIVRPMATLDFTRVVLRTAIPDDAFRFVPPDGVLPVDVTKHYLEQLKRAAEHEMESGGSGRSRPMKQDNR